MAQKDVRGFVIPLGRRLAAELGYEFVDAELVKEGPGRYLRIYVDKPGGITLDDCERYHRAVQPHVEAVDYDFLEVSSPGVDRPLKTDADYARAQGTEIEVKLYRPQDGAKAFAGILAGWDEGTLTIQTPAGVRTFARADVAQARPVIHFDDDDDEGES